MIDIVAMMMHWCAACVSSGHVIPGAAGVVGGAAGAVGGLGGLAGAGDAGEGDDGADEAELERELDRRYPPPLMTHILPPRGPTTGPPVEVGGPRTPEELIGTLGMLTGAGEIAAGLEAGEEVADVIQHYAANKLVEEGLEKASEAVGEAFDHVMEAESPADPDPIIGQTGSVANDDGTITTVHPDGSSSTPNTDGSVTTVNPDGSSSTSAPTATPETSGSVANDDGTTTTIDPAGGASTPNADGSVTIVTPDGFSTTFPP